MRAAWFSFRDLPPMQERHVLMINAAMAALRDRMDFTPIAFGLVPTSFTLGALQSAYELLLDQPLHKASFRRALNAAGLVKPTARWHTEGRGRPAQLFTFTKREPALV